MIVLPPAVIIVINRLLPKGLWVLAVALPLLALLLGLRTPSTAPLARTVSATADSDPLAWPEQDLFHRQAGNHSAPGTGTGTWTLHGIRLGGAQASAILGNEAGQQDSYAEGEQIAAGWQLQQVAASGVRLLGPGGLVELSLPAQADSLLRTAVEHAAVEHAAQPPASDTALPADAAPRLQAGTPLALWLQTQGLRVGDELLAVDGQPLTRLDAAALRAQLQGRDSVRLQWRRDGQTHTSVLRMP